MIIRLLCAPHISIYQLCRLCPHAFRALLLLLPVLIHLNYYPVSCWFWSILCHSCYRGRRGGGGVVLLNPAAAAVGLRLLLVGAMSRAAVGSLAGVFER